MDPVSNIPVGLDDLLKLGQVPVGVLTLYVLYQIMLAIKTLTARVDTVLQMMTGKDVKTLTNG